ncbi:MAG: class I SAM-dependent methyltransferase [Parcubacteria group bacterium]|jgi:ubiquinone/menaquinone biosynthesis C-methylase UbiE
MKEFFNFRSKNIKKPDPYFMDQGMEKGRTLEDYEEMLGIDRKELENKTILDLGAGPGAKFSKDLKKAGIKAKVVSLSADYSENKYSKEFRPNIFERLSITKDDDKKELAVAGMGEQLPFKDETFDEILALFSVSVWSRRDKEWLPEVMRVLKPGGCARIGPFRIPKMDMYDGDLMFVKREEMENYMKNMNFSYEFKTFFPLPSSENIGPLQQLLVVYKKNEKNN